MYLDYSSYTSTLPRKHAYRAVLHTKSLAQKCIRLPHNDPGFDYPRGRCKNQASLPSQGTVNGGAVSK